MSRFVDWLAVELGTDKWVVASRLTPRLRAKGYTLALSSARYTALEEKYIAPYCCHHCGARPKHMRPNLSARAIACAKREASTERTRGGDMNLTSAEWRFMAQRLREGAPGLRDSAWDGPEGCTPCVCMGVALRRLGLPLELPKGAWPEGLPIWPFEIHDDALAVMDDDLCREAQIAAFERKAEASAHTEKDGKP